MTSIESRGNVIGFSLTAVICFVFIVLCFTIKIEKKPVYKTIQIQLASVSPAPVKNSTPAKETVKSSVSSKASESKASSSKSSEKEKASVSKSSASNKTKTEPAKQVSKPVEQKNSSPTVYKKSVEELIAEQQNTAKKKLVWDDSMFDDVDSEPSASSSSVLATAKSGFSGSEGTSLSESEISKESESNAHTMNNVSSNTEYALKAIRDQQYSVTVADNVVGKVSAKISSANGQNNLQMSDGKLRELLYPKKPTIIISENSAKEVDVTRNVEISFVVSAAGLVAREGIDFKPAALLPLKVQNEIKDQISTWRFSADTQSSTAVLQYTLEIR